MSLARRIRDCRYAKGWGPDELADRAEISRTALYQIESGKTETPRAATLRRIAQALGVRIEALLGLEPVPILSEQEDDEGAALATPPHQAPFGNSALPARYPSPSPQGGPLSSTEHEQIAELERRFHALLASPLGEGVARIVNEAYRLLHTYRDRFGR